MISILSKKKIIGLLAALILALVWGSNFPIAKIGVTEIGAIEFKLASSIIGLLPIFLICLMKENFRELSLRNFLNLSFISLFNVAAVPTLNNISLVYTNTSNAIVLIYTMPAWTTLLSWMLGKNISSNGILSVGFCLLGVIFLFLSNISNGIGTGELIILFSAVLWSLGTLLQAHIKPEVTLLVGTTVQIAVGTLIVLGFYIFYYDFNLLNIVNSNITAISFKALLSLLFTGLLGINLAYFLWFFIIDNYGPIFASFSILLSPIVGVFMSHFVFNEKLTIGVIIGLFCMVFSMMFSEIKKARNGG